MATKDQSELYACTFPECNASFATQGQLKRHKKSTPEHDYCGICDEDFEDDQAFLIHKIESTKHIVCPMCSKDFRSEEGQQLHIKQVSVNRYTYLVIVALTSSRPMRQNKIFDVSAAAKSSSVPVD